MNGQTPVIILKEGTSELKGKTAHQNNIAAAKAVADAVRSTLGPRGMDKMLVDSMGDVVISNDGATILKEIDIEHPAAKMIVEVSKTQDQECGDGTTTAVILAGELLKQSETLLEQNVHPTIITTGYRIACEKAVEVLSSCAHKIDIKDRETLLKVAKTSMNSKSARAYSELLANIAVDAVLAVMEQRAGKNIADIDNIQVIKKQGGSVEDTKLIHGVIVDKEIVHSGMPKVMEKPKIALVDAAMEIKKTEVDAKYEITSPDQLQGFLDEEEKTLKKMVEFVKKSGANILFCQKGIDDLAQHYLAKSKIIALRRVKKSDMEKLSKATKARIVSKFEDLSPEVLGTAGFFEERKIGSDSLCFVSGCEGARAVSILIRGGTEHVIDEIDRALHDSLSVVKDAVEDLKISTGGGSTAMEVALALRDYAATVGGREQMAIEAFANAMEIIPKTLAENAGHDPINMLIELRKAHKNGMKDAGINVYTGKVSSMLEESVLEPLRVSTQALQSATDVAVMILRIDDVIAAKKLSKDQMKGPGVGGAGPQAGAGGGLDMSGAGM
ncbi:MAG: thermosome subunit beta [Thermoplasmata archaeon]